MNVQPIISFQCLLKLLSDESKKYSFGKMHDCIKVENSQNAKIFNNSLRIFQYLHRDLCLLFLT